MKIKGTNRKLKVNTNSLEDNSKGIFLKISKVGSCTRYMKNVKLHDVVNHFDLVVTSDRQLFCHTTSTNQLHPKGHAP